MEFSGEEDLSEFEKLSPPNRLPVSHGCLVLHSLQLWTHHWQEWCSTRQTRVCLSGFTLIMISRAINACHLHCDEHLWLTIGLSHLTKLIKKNFWIFFVLFSPWPKRKVLPTSFHLRTFLNHLNTIMFLLSCSFIGFAALGLEFREFPLHVGLFHDSQALGLRYSRHQPCISIRLDALALWFVKKKK